MVIRKAEQMLALIDGMTFFSELTVQRIVDFKEVQVVKARIQSLIALVVRAAMQHLGIYDALIVAEQNLTEQEEVRLHGIAERAKLSHKVRIQTVGHIQAQTVNLKFLNPGFDAGEEIIRHLRIVEI